ncbi:hypothetical protein H5410_030454 [Solanum commersonii]|uniref:Uncharacterized protein n=1 Tax=Solanum commersonii TaxID=4109 RepID=A0A9J5YIQ8_SOLCO|nr:hypothetical protein H5410_030454 [Solanum commersonii]
MVEGLEAKDHDVVEVNSKASDSIKLCNFVEYFCPYLRIEEVESGRKENQALNTIIVSCATDNMKVFWTVQKNRNLEKVEMIIEGVEQKAMCEEWKSYDKLSGKSQAIITSFDVGSASEVNYETIAGRCRNLCRSWEKTYKIPVMTGRMCVNLVDWVACIYGLRGEVK